MNTSPRKVNVCITVCLLVSLLLLLMTGGCSDDDCETCPTCPEVSDHNEIYDGLLYVSIANPAADENVGVYIFDTRTEQIVDSIPAAGAGIYHLDVTSDGRLLATGDELATTLVYDTGNLKPLKSFEMQTEATFAPDGSYLLLHRLKTRIYSVPAFNLIVEDTLDVGADVVFSKTRSSFFAIADRKLLYEYSLDTSKIIRSWQLSDRDGVVYDLWSFDLSLREQLAHLIVSGSHGSAFVTWDLTADTLINEHPLVFWTGSVCANAFGAEVYVTEPGYSLVNGVGTIYVFDRFTGEYLDGISLFGYRSNPTIPLSARNMVLAPDGSQLYVVADATQWNTGTVLRIDTKTRKIESLLFPSLDVYPYDVAIGPKP